MKFLSIIFQKFPENFPLTDVETRHPYLHSDLSRHPSVSVSPAPALLNPTHHKQGSTPTLQRSKPPKAKTKEKRSPKKSRKGTRQTDRKWHKESTHVLFTQQHSAPTVLERLVLAERMNISDRFPGYIQTFIVSVPERFRKSPWRVLETSDVLTIAQWAAAECSSFPVFVLVWPPVKPWKVLMLLHQHSECVF